MLIHLTYGSGILDLLNADGHSDFNYSVTLKQIQLTIDNSLQALKNHY